MVGGHQWAKGPQVDVDTIREGREFGESYGTTADWVRIMDNRSGRTRVFMRDRNGDGTRWFDAGIEPDHHG
jgi:hypothetical protein